MRYFGPMTRVRPGLARQDTPATYNLIWTDVDRPDALEALEGLRDVGLYPSAVVATGTPGHAHAYWKLSHELAVDEVERLNRRVCTALRGDPNLVPRNCLLRLPGFDNAKHGRAARVIDLMGCRYPAAAFDALPEPEAEVAIQPATGVAHAPQAGRTRVYIPSALRSYLDRCPERYAYGHKYGHEDAYATRSDAEAALCMYHIRAGWSDDEIVGLALRQDWPCLTDQRNPERWIRRTIAQARKYVLQEYGQLTFEQGGRPIGKRERELCDLLAKVRPQGERRLDYRRRLEAVLAGTADTRTRKANRVISRMEKRGLIVIINGRVHPRERR